MPKGGMSSGVAGVAVVLVPDGALMPHPPRSARATRLGLSSRERPRRQFLLRSSGHVGDSGIGDEIASISTTAVIASSTSSIRCVAHKTLMPSVSPPACASSARMPARDWISSANASPHRAAAGGGREQRARDFDAAGSGRPTGCAPCHAAGRPSRWISQQSVNARRRASAERMRMQRGMVGEVLVDAEVEIERARLEDNAELPQRVSGGAARCHARRCGSRHGVFRRDG